MNRTYSRGKQQHGGRGVAGDLRKHGVLRLDLQEPREFLSQMKGKAILCGAGENGKGTSVNSRKSGT